MKKMLTGEQKALLSYQRRRGLATSHHIDTILKFAEGAMLAVEFGVRNAVSTVALLCAAHKVVSYDVESHDPSFYRQIEMAFGTDWEFRLESSLVADPIECDILMHDSLHSYEQVHAELSRHADLVQKRIFFHDTVSHGDVGQSATVGPRDPKVLGIRPAIDQLMIRDPSWHIVWHDPSHSGFLVLERR